MQWGLLYVDTEVTPVLARGRGLANLIEGLSKGDPVAWSITIGFVVILGGMAIYKHFSDSE